ncbi:Stk1 family PASTA domain-containing Ser/Thr kinase [Pseudalkalibacillus salsuginis]|uniref:Stk1 family PASTA domain-containing Ser/Thr kinase n=1 Tax=Pseudalkalibacillus salsuginis TaxID=2910972 RepID=UPI001F388764|nr:Stk1 family PASTA domain-containing Ser/Thr kinase [Pseudalkalibacillus salsuginis]MCF6410518.1 Stk1 family PASTA domain-containing Ser/Thr kinase [Pseudalkalibacillus salsuginis]
MIGRRISSRYKILEIIGDGGMAVVYKAEDLILDRIVAVKVLRSEYSTDEDFIRRFRREAESATSLNHPNVVNIVDVGEEEQIYFIVMEYVKGKTLKQIIRENGPLSPERAVEIMKQISSAIAHAHEHHIVHRDIKPHNILIDENGNAKVTDFGIALAATSATITHTHSVLGSVHYFSPEQARGGIANNKSDIYSLGVVFYEMVTGRLPFSGESAVSVALKHLQEKFPEPKLINPDIPQSIENIILKAMAKNPNERFENVQALEEDLRTVLDPDRIDEPKHSFDEDEEATKVLTPIGNITEQMKTAPVPSTKGEVGVEKGGKQKKEKKDKKKKKNWVAIILMVFLLLGIAGVAAVTLWPEIFQTKDVSVPDVINQPYTTAYEKIKDAGLNPEKEEQPSSEVEEGHVIRQTPSPGTAVKENQTVKLIVSSGPEKFEVENYVGQEEDDVKRTKVEDLFKRVDYPTRSSEDVPAGQIIEQIPEAGEMVVPGQEVLILYVSSGPPPFDLADLIGKSLEEANTYANGNGLKLKEAEREYSEDVDDGNIIRTDPKPGETVRAGSEITVTVSKGVPEPVTIKDMVEVEFSEEDSGSGDGNGEGNKNKDKKDKQKEPKQVRIVTNDANGERTIVDKEISETEMFEIPLTIKYNGEGSYKVYVDDEEYYNESFTYEEAKNFQNGE